MKFCHGYVFALILFCGLPPVASAEDAPYQDFLKRLPDTTNVLIVADVPALKKALGVAPGQSLISGDDTSIPLMAKKFVVGMQIDLAKRKHL